MGDLALPPRRHRGDRPPRGNSPTTTSGIASWLRFTPYQRFPAACTRATPKVSPDFFAWLQHRTQDAYWTAGHPSSTTRESASRCWNFEGWYDAFLNGGVQNFTGMVKRRRLGIRRANQRLASGPYDHIGWGRPDSIEAPMLKSARPGGELAGHDPDAGVVGPTTSKASTTGVGTLARRWTTSSSVSNTWPHHHQLATTRHPRHAVLPQQWAGQREHRGGGRDTVGQRTRPGGPTRITTATTPPTRCPALADTPCCAAAGVGTQGPYGPTPRPKQRPDVLTLHHGHR